jgi:NADPH-dependent ferric siderophore reductase
MRRIVLAGEDLAGFTSLAFDDHVKVFFPRVDDASQASSGGEAASPFEARDFTPRRYDAEAGELWIDFYLHEDGPASRWARQAEVGQALEVGGPRGSVVLHMDGIESLVMIGDETALPAIARRLEEMPPDIRTLVIIEGDGAEPSATLQQRIETDSVRVDRGLDAVPAQALIERLRQLENPLGRCFVWVALESKAARAVRRYLTEERGFDKAWVKAAGYWQRGAVGAHELIAEEA